MFKIPADVAAFRFLVFKIPDRDTSFTELGGNTLGLGPNLVLPTIVQFALRGLFAASHNLVAGQSSKVAL